MDIDILAFINSASGASPANGDAGGNGTPRQASFDPKHLRLIRGKLNFQGDQLIVANQTLQNVSVQGHLQDGQLRLQLEFDQTSGTVQATLEVKGGETPMQNSIRANFDETEGGINIRDISLEMIRSVAASDLEPGDDRRSARQDPGPSPEPTFRTSE